MPINNVYDVLQEAKRLTSAARIAVLRKDSAKATEALSQYQELQDNYGHVFDQIGGLLHSAGRLDDMSEWDPMQSPMSGQYAIPTVQGNRGKRRSEVAAMSGFASDQMRATFDGLWQAADQIRLEDLSLMNQGVNVENYRAVQRGDKKMSDDVYSLQGFQDWASVSNHGAKMSLVDRVLLEPMETEIEAGTKKYGTSAFGLLTAAVNGMDSVIQGDNAKILEDSIKMAKNARDPERLSQLRSLKNKDAKVPGVTLMEDGESRAITLAEMDQIMQSTDLDQETANKKIQIQQTLDKAISKVPVSERSAVLNFWNKRYGVVAAEGTGDNLATRFKKPLTGKVLPATPEESIAIEDAKKTVGQGFKHLVSGPGTPTVDEMMQTMVESSPVYKHKAEQGFGVSSLFVTPPKGVLVQEVNHWLNQVKELNRLTVGSASLKSGAANAALFDTARAQAVVKARDAMVKAGMGDSTATEFLKNYDPTGHLKEGTVNTTPSDATTGLASQVKQYTPKGSTVSYGVLPIPNSSKWQIVNAPEGAPLKSGDTVDNVNVQ